MENLHDKCYPPRVPSPVLRSSHTTVSVTLTSGQAVRLRVHAFSIEEIGKHLRCQRMLIGKSVPTLCNEASVEMLIPLHRISFIAHERHA